MHSADAAAGPTRTKRCRGSPPRFTTEKTIAEYSLEVELWEEYGPGEYFRPAVRGTILLETLDDGLRRVVYGAADIKKLRAEGVTAGRADGVWYFVELLNTLFPRSPLGQTRRSRGSSQP